MHDSRSVTIQSVATLGTHRLASELKTSKYSVFRLRQRHGKVEQGQRSKDRALGRRTGIYYSNILAAHLSVTTSSTSLTWLHPIPQKKEGIW